MNSTACHALKKFLHFIDARSVVLQQEAVGSRSISSKVLYSRETCPTVFHVDRVVRQHEIVEL